MARTELDLKPKADQRIFMSPENLAAMIFLAQVMAVRELLFDLQIIAAHQRFRREA